MINFEEIAAIIENPALIGKEDIPAMLELSKKYPYSPIFSTLALKGLAKEKAINFEEELTRYAYKIPDRSQLYFFIQSVDNIRETQVVEEGLKEPEIREEIIAEDPEFVQEEESLLLVDKEQEEAQEVVEQEQEQEREQEQEQEREEQSLPVKSIKDLDLLEKEMLAHAVSVSISLEVDEEIEALEQEQELDLSRLREMDKEISVSEKEEDVSIEFGWEENTEEEKQLVSTSTNSFLEWMSPNITAKLSGETLEKEEIDEKTNQKKNILVVEKEKKEFYSSKKKAAESLDESELPVSDTLAKLYVMQGHYPKAIEAYRKLILKFPEKKSFFALQIESLKNKLK